MARCPVCKRSLPRAPQDRHVSYTGYVVCSGTCAQAANDLPRAPPNYVSLVVDVQRALRAAPQRPADLVDSLGVGRRTVERVLRGLESAGENVTKEKNGREVWYRIAP